MPAFRLGHSSLFAFSICRGLEHTVTPATMWHAKISRSAYSPRLLPINRSRLVVLVLLTIAGWGASCYAQRKQTQPVIPRPQPTAPVVRPSSSNTSAAVEAARERANQIIQNNAETQEAIKEAGDRLQEELVGKPAAGRGDDSGQNSECVRTGGLALAYMCGDPDWKCEMGVGPCTGSGESYGSSGPSVSDAPYVSDLKDKILPDAPLNPAGLLRDSQQLLQTTDCAALMSTYRPGPARALPPECMTAAEAMSVYTPIGRSQPAAPSVPEPVIDGSQIPSIIDFTLGPSPSQSSQSISPSLQQLANHIQIDDSPSEPAAGPSPSVSQSNGGSQLSVAQEDSGTVASEPSPTSAEGQDSASESDSGSGVIDQIFKAGKKAQEAWKNLQIQVGDHLRGITRDADGAPVKKGSKADTKTDSNQDDVDINRAQNPANLGKGFNKYDSDLHDTTNKKIDKLLDQ